MCEPLSIASGALLVGSTLAGMAGQGEVDSARDDAMSAENARQKKLRAEAAAALGKSEADFSELPGKQQQTGDELADILNKNTTQQAPPTNLMPGVSDPTVVREVGKQTDKAKAFTNQQGNALGQLRAFGDTMGDANRNLGGNAQWINSLGGFQQGSAGVLNSELAAANDAGQGWGTLGDILGGVGSIGLTAGLTKGAGPGSAPASILDSSGLPPIPKRPPVSRGGAGPLNNFYG